MKNYKWILTLAGVLIFAPMFLYAEEELDIPAHEFMIRGKVKRSTINPNLSVMGEDKFACPGDVTIIIPEPKHGVPFECGGYVYEVRGNAVYILGKAD